MQEHPLGRGKSPAQRLGFDTVHQVPTSASRSGEVFAVASGLRPRGCFAQHTQPTQDHLAPMNIPSPSSPHSENHFLSHLDTPFLSIFVTNSPHRSFSSPFPSPVVVCPCPSPSAQRSFFTRLGLQKALVAQRQPLHCYLMLAASAPHHLPAAGGHGTFACLWAGDR